MAGFDRESERRADLAAIAAAAAMFVFCPHDSPAQEAGEEDAADDTIEEIVVIGSCLRRRDFSSPSPIATIDREALYASGQGTLETSLSQIAIHAKLRSHGEQSG